MPYQSDPSIYGLSGGQRSAIADPFAVRAAQIEMQNRQLEAESLAEQRRGIAEERQMRLRAGQREEADRAAGAEAFRAGGGVRDKTLAWAFEKSPQLIPSLTEYFDKADESAAKVLKRRHEMQGIEADYFGTLAEGAIKHGGSMDAIQTALSHAVEKFPEYEKDAAGMLQQLQGADDAGRLKILETIRDGSPSYQAAMKAAAAKNTPQVVAPGGALVDDTGKELYKAPEREEIAALGSLPDFLDDEARKQGLKSGRQLDPKSKEKAIARYKSLGEQHASGGGGGSMQQRPLTQNAEALMINRIAGQWTKATEQTKEINRQFKIMQAAISRFDQDPNSASQGVLVTFQKMLDPDSVVRESEYARSSHGVSMMQRIEGYMEQLAKGGAGVPKAQLQEMVKTAELFKAATTDGNQGIRKRLGATADRYNIPHDLIFNDGGSSSPAAAGAGMVMMKAPGPNGAVMPVPAADVEHYKAKGATVVGGGGK